MPPIVLDGTAGITTPGLTNTGTETIVNLTTTGNTILGDASTDTLNVGNGGLVKDASGNVGIGTSSPTVKLDVRGNGLKIYDSGSTTANLQVRNSTTGDAAGFTLQQDGVNTLFYNNSNGASVFATNGTERMRIDSSGNVGIGTSSPSVKLDVAAITAVVQMDSSSGTAGAAVNRYKASNRTWVTGVNATDPTGAYTIYDVTASAERMRIDSSGNLLVGKTANNITDAGQVALSTGRIWLTTSANDSLTLNRLTNDGVLAEFRQDSTVEGSISVSGTTVSYNGGHLSRWAQTTTAKDESLVKGTVLSNLDEMNVYTDAEGNTVDNEQLNKVKVSDVEGDVNVAGVFVNWSHDDSHDVDEINMAMTGDMVIRIAQGTTVQRGDLLMSAGDGTAKPQGDDIVRSKTVAKVTSTHVTCTYADGSFCVPCVLMAC